MNDRSLDLARTTLAVLALIGLIAASLWILRPFVPSLIWATTIVVATWPVMLRVQGALWGRRALAVAVMTAALLLLLIVPLALAVKAIVDNVDRIAGWAHSLQALRAPRPPEWVQALPVVGARVTGAWERTMASGGDDLVSRLAPYAGQTVRWFVGQVGGLGLMMVQFLLTVLVAAILYARGESAADGVMRFGRRLAGPQGEDVMRLAAQAIRGVALGVVVTALAQALVGGIGLAVAGIPFSAVLTGVMFLLAVAQVGAWPVLVPAVGWLYWSGSAGWGTFLLVCTVVVASLDNVLRPVLIRKGADLPLLLIVAGVIGGLVAFGLVGIFIGPVLLAVTYTLLEAWVREGREDMPR